LPRPARIPRILAMGNRANTLVSIVVPCYNEEAVIGAFLSRARAIASQQPQYDFEFLFVDDGSTDGTPTVLDRGAQRDPAVKVLTLSRNFGHQRAITAGLDHCTGEFIVVIDADLQDPPEMIPEILKHLQEGIDLVHLVRADRNVDSPLKRFSAQAFYWVMRHFVLPELPQDAGDFKGFNRDVLRAVRQYRERVRFMRGLFATTGYKQARIHYTRAARHGGRSKYPISKVLRFAADAIVSFTVLPLRFIWLAGLLAIMAGAALGSLGLFGVAPLGIALLSMVVVMCTGAIFIALGIFGEYVARMYEELQARPLYHVEASRNIDVPSDTVTHHGDGSPRSSG
jgi:polyisoprenyl-phosphate glycosyltransferase